MTEQEWTSARREVIDVYSNSVRVATCDHQGQADAVIAAFKAQPSPASEASDVERLWAALEWYANEANYSLEELYSEDPRLRAKGVTYRARPILEDDGQRARDALGAAARPAVTED